MASMFKSLKDARRRAVETVLEAAGASEKTVDEEFETSHVRFGEMVEDLNECGAALSSVLVLQKKYIADVVEMSKCLSRIYTKNLAPDYWNICETTLSEQAAAKAYEDAITSIHEVVRSSAAKVSADLALEPLRSAVTKMCPEVESACKERATCLKDYDSYRRRLKALKGKLETAAQDKTAELQAEITKYENKVSHAEEAYNTSNNQTKKEIMLSKKAHDSLIDMLLITVVTCQAEMFAQAARDYQQVVDMMPQDKVEKVRNMMNQYIRQGGAKVAAPEETSLSTGLKVAMGKAEFVELMGPSDAEKKDARGKKEEEIERAKAIVAEDEKVKGSNPFAPPPPVAAPVPTNPFTSSSPTLPSAPPPPPPQRPATKQVTVVALFDHETDEDDELPFKAGDEIIVLESSDSGWWKGKLASGATGIFPVNYVKAT